MQIKKNQKWVPDIETFSLNDFKTNDFKLNAKVAESSLPKYHPRCY